MASAVTPKTIAPARRSASPAAAHASHGIAMPQATMPSAAVGVWAVASALEYGAWIGDTRPSLAASHPLDGCGLSPENFMDMLQQRSFTPLPLSFGTRSMALRSPASSLKVQSPAVQEERAMTVSRRAVL